MNEPEKNIEGLGDVEPSPEANFYEQKEEVQETPESLEDKESTPPDAEASEVEETSEKPPDTGDQSDEEVIEETISMGSDLVEQQGWDWDWFKSLKYPVKVGDETKDIAFSELVRSFKDAGVADDLLKQAKATRQSQEQEIAEQRQSLEAQFVVAAKLIENAETIFNPQAQSIDWGSLRENDPAEYAAKKAEFADFNQGMEKAKAEIKQEYEKAILEQQKQLMETRDKQIEQERVKLLETFPELRDESELKKRGGILQDHLRSQGFSKEEIADFYDHRLITMAEHQRLWLEGQSRVDVAKKKVAKVPKVMKPGAKAEKKKPLPTDAATILYGA